MIDQEPSQANRVEEALREARDAGPVRLPMFELRVTRQGEIRLTSLDFPHRYADAYVRDSLVDGVRFDQSLVGQAAPFRDGSGCLPAVSARAMLAAVRGLGLSPQGPVAEVRPDVLGNDVWPGPGSGPRAGRPDGPGAT